MRSVATKSRVCSSILYRSLTLPRATRGKAPDRSDCVTMESDMGTIALLVQRGQKSTIVLDLAEQNLVG